MRTSAFNLSRGAMRFAAIMLLAVATLSCKQGATRIRTSGKQKVLPQVAVMAIEPSCGVGMRSYVGTVTASRSTRISARHSGRIESLRISEGCRVKEGDVLAIISSETIKSTLKTAQATYDYAKDGLERAEKVHQSGTITDQNMVQIRADFTKAEAALAAAREAFEECTIRAPFSGIIGSVDICEGESVAVLQILATLLDVSSPEVEISVPEAEMSLVEVGDEMTVSVQALGEATFSAILRTKGVTASSISHSYTCTLAPEKHVDGLLPGMVCNVVSNDSKGMLVLIPPQTVRTDTSGRYVWLVREGIVEKRHITISGYSGNSLVVTEGLSSGDLLIVEGAQRVSTGMRVDVVEK